MTSKGLLFFYLILAMVFPMTLRAATDVSCGLIVESAQQSRAVTSKYSVVVAINANDVDLNNSKQSSIYIRRKLQAMFIEYCKNFSGYKVFQVSTKAASVSKIKCENSFYFTFLVDKENITISELSGAGKMPSIDIPELEKQSDFFAEFK